ncbi:plasmid mobilization relaxosome protein MobC [Bacteroides acidifaciens]|uniref:plasmid mobilization relaxosome protein MobC n=1 Tax=Bacteroides acidifaciens TaxID=85831 RepID=UPI0030142E3D
MKSKSTFLRRLILYGYVYDIDYSGLRDYNTTPGKTSSNLNQIAKRMNATGNVYKTDVEEVKKLMKQVWDTQLAMLKKQPNMKQ